MLCTNGRLSGSCDPVQEGLVVADALLPMALDSACMNKSWLMHKCALTQELHCISPRQAAAKVITDVHIWFRRFVMTC